MSQPASATIRSTFNGLASAFVDLVHQIEADAWNEIALGVWTVRDLVGHTSRSLSTIESYLGTATPGPHLESPVAYFRATRLALADKEAVAQRGRDAGAALGEDPAPMVRALAERVTALVAHSPDDAIVGTPVGTMSLANYLPTRAFELTVHGLDLARAQHLVEPAGIEHGVREALALAGQLAADSPGSVSVLMALTGRAALPEGFSLV